MHYIIPIKNATQAHTLLKLARPHRQLSAWGWMNTTHDYTINNFARFRKEWTHHTKECAPPQNHLFLRIEGIVVKEALQTKARYTADGKTKVKKLSFEQAVELLNGL